MGLVESFAHHSTFWLNNPLTERADINVDVSFPDVLARRDWDLLVGAGQSSFTLPARGSQQLHLRLVPGQQFTAADVQAGDAIEVTVEVAGIPVGGLSYPLDPTIEGPPAVPDEEPSVDIEDLEDVLGCLDEYTGDFDRVQVKRILIALDFDLEDCD